MRAIRLPGDTRRLRSMLYACPLCGSGWVARRRYEELCMPQIQVELRCGGCGTWRRLTTTCRSAAVHERGMQHDSARMTRALERLERRQAIRGATDLTAALSLELVDAGDFAGGHPADAWSDVDA